MPDPGLVSGPRPEVWLAVVVDLRGEAEKPAVRAGVGIVCAFGQTVLFLGTLQHVHGPVLQVGGLLHNLGIQDQVWGRCEGESIKGRDGFRSEVWNLIFLHTHYCTEPLTFSYLVVYSVTSSTVSYSEYRKPQQRNVLLLWDSQRVSHDADTDPESAQFLNISLHSSPHHQLTNLLASTMFPEKRDTQKIYSKSFSCSWCSCLSAESVLSHSKQIKSKVFKESSV